MVFEWKHEKNVVAERIAYEKLEREPLVIVKEYERVIMLYEGKIYAVLEPGKHQLMSVARSIPGLGAIIAKLSTFRLDVIYVDMRDISLIWGGGDWLSKDNVNIGAHGEFLVKIGDPKLFTMNLMGAEKIFTQDDFRRALGGYIQDVLRQVVNRYAARDLYVAKSEYEQPLNMELRRLCERWGLQLISWNSVWNVPDEIRHYWEVTVGLKGEAEIAGIRREYEIREMKLERELGMEGKVREFELERDRKEAEAGIELLRQLKETTEGYRHKLEMEKIDKLKGAPELAEVYLEKDTLVSIAEKGPEAATKAAEAVAYKHKKPLADLKESEITAAPPEVHREEITLKHLDLSKREAEEKEVSKCPHCGEEIKKGWKACPSCGEKV